MAGVSILFFGYDQGMMAGVNNTPYYATRMDFGYGNDEGGVVVTNSTRQGGIVAIYYLGTLFGAIAGGYLGDKLGRVKSIAVGAAWAILGASLQCSAMNVAWMCCARVINGCGTGILNAVVPVYSAETAEYKSRGMFIAFEFTLNILGVVVAYWLEYGLSYVNGGYSDIRWRLPIGFQIAPLLVLFAAIWVFPESPRWLIKNGQNDEALYILQRLRGTETNEAEEEYQDICHIIELEKHNSKLNSYWNMFFGIGSGDLHLGRRVQLVIWLQILQEWIGIAGITVYAPTIFANAGFDSNKSNWLSGLNNIFYMFATIINAFTVDRFGRRMTLYWGAIAQGIAMFLAGGFSRAQINNPDNTAWGAASASFIFIYTSVFGATWLVVPWLYPTEVFPLQVRARGNAFGVIGWSIGNGWLTLLCPIMFNHIGEKTLYIFGAFNVVSLPIVYCFYPETAKRTLEEVDFLFAAKTPWAWDAEKEFKRLSDEDRIARANEGISGAKAHEMDKLRGAEAGLNGDASSSESVLNAPNKD